jgi:Acetyltransferase (GNAT) family.
MPHPDFSIRIMTRGEVDFAIELAASEGWNPGLSDAGVFYQTDPDGFFLGLLGGKPVGCVSAVSYEGAFGFIGLFIVVPEHRGKGFGRALWDRAMRHLAGHNIGLDGVVEQQANYRKSGFKLAYRNIRYRGDDFPRTALDDEVVPLENLNFEELLTYDSMFFPVGRGRFLAGWIGMPESHGLGCIQKGRLCGYGLLRRCRQGFKVGPLLADNETIADKILLPLSSYALPEESIFLDVPEVNPVAMRLVQRYGMTKVFETARMYTGPLPPIKLSGVFGVTTFELG